MEMRFEPRFLRKKMQVVFCLFVFVLIFLVHSDASFLGIGYSSKCVLVLHSLGSFADMFKG